MRLTRRSFVALTGGVLVGSLVSGCGGAARGSGSTGTLLPSTTPLPGTYGVPLPIPPTVRPSVGSDGIARAGLDTRVAEVEILPGRTTRIMGYDGIFPGPTIRARAGQETRIEIANSLDVDTVVHLHGGVTPPGHDGYPTDYIRPGTTREYWYPLGQRAAPLWYHDHTLDFTGPNVYAGLAGMFLLEDPVEDELGLPTGERDLPLVIADRSFGEDAQLAYPLQFPDRRYGGVEREYHGGVLGDCVLVNGAPWPVLEVDAARYRFRVVNAANARRFDLRLDAGASFVQVGTDLGLLEAPLDRSGLVLATGERADVVVDFGGLAPGTEVTMTNALGAQGTAAVMRFVVARRVRSDDTRVPDRLGTIERLSPSDVVTTRDLHFSLGVVPDTGRSGGHDMPMWSVNGITFVDGDVATPRLGTLERWRLSSDVHHPVHAHLLHAQTTLSGGEWAGHGPPAWKDTIDLLPGSTAEVLVPIQGWAGRYVLHCHNLEHEDMMMMVHFSVAD